MKIGIDGSRAFLGNRTGIEEYSYQVIKHLRKEIEKNKTYSQQPSTCEQVILYLRKNQEKNIDFELPKNWKIKIIKLPRFWTQIGLSLEMLFRPVDVLFIPAHTVPLIHPKKTIVVIHGLEYEFLPKAYSLWERIYMRASIKFSCKWASEIISVSKNTKKDLIELYKVSENKIKVIYEGYEKSFRSNFINKNSKNLLFIGRLEERKNILGIIESFEILKKKENIPHNLILAGGEGYGFETIKSKVENSKWKNDIIMTGYVSEEKKWELLEDADVFLFPTFYEGFGIPILEAQSVGTSVVASNNSSIPEVAEKSAILIDPKNSQEIAEAVMKIISNEDSKDDIIRKGYENVKRFSWEKCAGEIAKVIANSD